LCEPRLALKPIEVRDMIVYAMGCVKKLRRPCPAGPGWAVDAMETLV